MPAYFDDAQRDATADAGYAAGLEKVRSRTQSDEGLGKVMHETVLESSTDVSGVQEVGTTRHIAQEEVLQHTVY